MNANLKLASGRLLACEKAPYFRSVLHGLSPKEVPGIGTIGVTDRAVLLYDPEWVAERAPENMAALLVHEVMHIVLNHGRRGLLSGHDPRKSNIAGDLAINPLIEEMGFKLPEGENKGVFPEMYGFPRGLTQDEYYELLTKQEEQQGGGQGQKQKPGKGKDKGQGKSGGQGGKGQPDQPNDEQGDGGQGGDDDHDHDGHGQPQDKPGAGQGWCGSCAGRPLPDEPDGGPSDTDSRAPSEVERMTRAVAEAVRHEAQRGRSNVPASLRRWAEDQLAPAEVDWRTQLARLTRAAVAWRDGAVDHRYDAPGRRQAGLGYGAGRPVLPRLRNPVPKVAVIGDTSGSMGADELASVLRETNGILKNIGAEVTFAACDAQVHGVTKVRTARELGALLHGGGGTDMRPAFEALAKQRPKPEVIVCITDGQVGDGVPQYAPQGVKVLWVLVGPYQMQPATWGTTISIPYKGGKAP